jgi:hypothetical protein
VSCCCSIRALISSESEWLFEFEWSICVRGGLLHRRVLSRFGSALLPICGAWPAQ